MNFTFKVILLIVLASYVQLIELDVPEHYWVQRSDSKSVYVGAILPKSFREFSQTPYIDLIKAIENLKSYFETYDIKMGLVGIFLIIASKFWFKNKLI